MKKRPEEKQPVRNGKKSSDTSGLNPAEQEQAALYLNKVDQISDRSGKCRDSCRT